LAEDATQHFVGSGVRCETASGVVLVGNRTLMDEQHVRVFVVYSRAVILCGD
jgi:cation transport ATPase